MGNLTNNAATKQQGKGLFLFERVAGLAKTEGNIRTSAL